MLQKILKVVVVMIGFTLLISIAAALPLLILWGLHNFYENVVGIQNVNVLVATVLVTYIGVLVSPFLTYLHFKDKQ